MASDRQSMQSRRQASARRWQLGGWILFVISAVFFTAASVRAGDMLALAGSLFFLLACFLFMVPLWREHVD